MSTSAAPARQLSGLNKYQTRSTLAFLNWNAGLRSIFGTVSGSGSFIFVAFALQLGIAKEQMGLIAFMANAACIMQVLGLVVINRARNKKRMLVRLAMAEPLVLLVAVVIVPFLPQGWRLYGLILATFASAAVLNLTRPLSDDWMASAIPSGLRENFLGRRMEIMNAIAIGATLVSGFAADNVQQWGATGLSILLALGAVIGILAALPLRRAVLPSITARASVSWPDIKGVLRDKAFRRYMAIVMLIDIPFCLSAPYYQVFNLQVLHFSNTKIAFMTVCYLVIRVVLARTGGRMVSRFGPGRMIFFSGIMYTLFFSGYLITAGGQSWPAFAGWMIAALGEVCFGVAQGTALYNVVPHTPARSAYFAVFNLILLMAFAVGSLIAMSLVQWFKNYPITVGRWELGNFHCLFALVTVLMLLCTCAIPFVRLDAARAVSDTGTGEAG